MVNHYQTKNLVIIYQKLLNLALKKQKTRSIVVSPLTQKINIRSCSGVKSFKRLLLDYPNLRKILMEMFVSGELLESLLKWRGQYCNLAISLKYLNRLMTIIQNPQIQGVSWTDSDLNQSSNEEVSRNKKDSDDNINFSKKQTKDQLEVQSEDDEKCQIFEFVFSGERTEAHNFSQIDQFFNSLAEIPLTRNNTQTFSIMMMNDSSSKSKSQERKRDGNL